MDAAWGRIFRLLVNLSFALAFLGLLLHGPGRGDDDSPTRQESPPALDRSWPQAVLASLREAYLDRQADDYDSLLAVDFEFHFAEEDHVIAEKYTRSEEMGVHEHMFSRFWLRRERRVTPGTGRPIWTIVKWREDRSGNLDHTGPRGAMVEDCTWGQIKALF